MRESKNFQCVLAFVIISLFVCVVCSFGRNPIKIVEESSNCTPINSFETLNLVELAEEKIIEKPKLLSPCNLELDELQARLKGLSGYADTFLLAEKETGINAVFLASIAALESGWNTSNVASKYNNLFGWTIGNNYAKFKSKEECILYVASQLKEKYLTENGVYFEGYLVGDVGVHYNGRPEWAIVVNKIMRNLEGY